MEQYQGLTVFDAYKSGSCEASDCCLSPWEADQPGIGEVTYGLFYSPENTVSPDDENENTDP